MLAVQINGFARDEQMPHVRRDFQWVAFGKDDVGDLAFLETAELIAESKNLGRVDRDRLQGFVPRQAESNGHAGEEGEIPGVSRITGGESKPDSRFGHLACDRKDRVIGIGIVVG